MDNKRTLFISLSLAASSVVLSLGSTALGQSESSAASGMAAPAPFTARLGCGQDDGLNERGTVTALEDDPSVTVATIPRTVWRFPTLEVSDPRMGGRVYGYLAGTEWSSASWDDDMGVYSALWHVINDGGEWTGSYAGLRTPETGYANNTIRLEGHGGYEGLYAVIQTDFRDDCGFDVTGYILERDVPAFPQPLPALSE